ncbi:MAG: leucine-rich repeat domain-containing protein [Rikenellaceae bacterium]
MKKIIYLFISIFAIAALSCSKSSSDIDTTPDTTTPEVGTTINVVISTEAPSATKVSYTSNSDGSEFAFSWNSGDEISVAVPAASDNTNSKFTAESSTSTANLSGQVVSWEGSCDLYAIFPYKSSGYSVSSSGTFTHSLASQTVDASSNNSFENSLMVAVASDATAVSDEDYYIPTLSFQQVMSFYQLSLKDIPTDETIVEIGFEASNNIFVESATVDLTSAELSNKTMTSAISASVSNTSGTTATLNFALFPVDLSSQSVTMYVKTMTTDGYNQYSKEFNPAANFERNTFIHHGEELSLSDFDGSEVADFMLADFSSTSYPTGDTWIIADNGSPSYEEFEGLRAALNAVGEQISLSFPYIESFPEYALEYMENLVSISADLATEISGGAFQYCTNLSSVTLPNATYIREYAFCDCCSLSLVSLPEATTIEIWAFAYCNLSSVSLPKATTIGDSAFISCSELSSVSLPEATTIGSYAFAFCSTLSSVNLPEVTTVGENTFRECHELITISLPEAVVVRNEAFCACEQLDTLSLPKVKFMMLGAIAECYSLSTLEVATDSSTKLLIFWDIDWGLGICENISLSIGIQSSEYVDGNVLHVTLSSTDNISDDDLYQYLVACGWDSEDIENVMMYDSWNWKNEMTWWDYSYTFKEINIVGGVSSLVAASGENAGGTTLGW